MRTESIDTETVCKRVVDTLQTTLGTTERTPIPYDVPLEEIWKCLRDKTPSINRAFGECVSLERRLDRQEQRQKETNRLTMWLNQVETAMVRNLDCSPCDPAEYPKETVRRIAKKAYLLNMRIGVDPVDADTVLMISEQLDVAIENVTDDAYLFRDDLPEGEVTCLDGDEMNRVELVMSLEELLGECISEIDSKPGGTYYFNTVASFKELARKVALR